MNISLNKNASKYISECLRDYIRFSDISSKTFLGKIHQNDEMYHNTVAKVFKDPDESLFRYYDSGARSSSVIKQICDAYFDGISKDFSILEFACGHGRMTRHLLTWLKPQNIFCSDIYADAVTFQQEYMGVDAFVSNTNPAAFRCDKKFDLLIAGSFFTHMPDHLFSSWLTVLSNLVKDDGLLCFTTRGDHTNVGGRKRGEIDETGILFLRKSESNALPYDVYGLTTVTDAYVKKAIDENVAPDIQVKCFRKAFYENQDLYILSKAPNGNFSEIAVKALPICGIRNARRDNNGVIVVKGWAVELNPGDEIIGVELYINDRKQTAATITIGDKMLVEHFPGTPAKAAINWSVELNDEWRDNQLICAKIKSSSGRTNRCYLPPARGLYPEMQTRPGKNSSNRAMVTLESRNTQRFIDKLICACGSTNWTQNNLTGDVICSKCRTPIRYDSGIYYLIPKEKSTNPLEKIDYDSAHSVSLDKSFVLSEKYFGFCKYDKQTDLDVLELGCGTGLLTLGLASDERTGQCISLDMSRSFLHSTRDKIKAHVKKTHPTILLCADINNIPFKSQSFDLVVGNSILHHIYDYEALILRTFDLVRPGGCVIFNEPCQEGKSLIAFFLRLIIRQNALMKKPVFTTKEINIVEGTIHVLMREKATAGKPEMKKKMEDKHIFRINSLKKIVKSIGFSSFDAYNVAQINDGYRMFVERTLHTAGLDKNIEPFGSIFKDFEDVYVHFFRDELKTPHQFFVFQR